MKARETLLNTIEEAGRACVRAIRFVLRATAAMSWPALMVTSVAVALALTIVPLALIVFAVFVVIKLVVTAIVLDLRRRRAPRQLTGSQE